jgi:pimeloyl-ACP methyl ester carboxylesterase
MGLGGTFNQWDPQIEYLTRSPEYQVCVYDNRGIGYSTSPDAIRWRTSDMAADAIKILDHLNWTSGVNAIGLSMGGMITQELVLADPNRFSSMALISTIAGGVSSLYYFLLALPTGQTHLIATFVPLPPPLPHPTFTQKPSLACFCTKPLPSPPSYTPPCLRIQEFESL